MTLPHRASTWVLSALASLAAFGCADPCEQDERCVDQPARPPPTHALQTPRTDAGAPAPEPVVGLDAAAPASGVTFSVEGSPSAKLVVAGASCAGARCTLASVPAGTVRVDLTLTSHGTADMPVWVRWRGCEKFDGQLWPVWSTGPTPEYQTLYTHVFEGLKPGSSCVAEVAQGTWYIFAGNRSVKATTGAEYCREQFSSPENLNLHCFIPAKGKVALASDLRAWQCFTVGPRAASTPTNYRQGSVSFTAAGNEVVSCSGSAL